MNKILLFLLCGALYAETSLFEEYWQTAGMDELLNGKGSYTVFAPDDEGFREIDTYIPNFLEQLKAPEERPRLQRIMKYHVVEGTHKTSDLKDGEKIPTMIVFPLRVSHKDNKLMINDAEVKGQGKEGIIVIDKVLIPPPVK